jgi:glycosyltransferase involved in cell wall biosynthesis
MKNPVKELPRQGSGSMVRRFCYVVLCGLPKPYGGVTIFNGDLVEMLLQHESKVVVFDQNHGAKEERFEAVDIRVCWSQKRIFYHLWVTTSLLWTKSDRVILHTTNTFGLLRLVVPIALRVPCTIFFHNGEVERAGTSKITRRLLCWLMRFVDRAFVMSQKQFNDLAEKGYPLSNVNRIIPVLQAPNEAKVKPDLRDEQPAIIVACGYEMRLYNFEFAVRLVQELPGAVLHLYLYGQDVDAGYLNELRAIDTHGKLSVFRNQNRMTFQAALHEARLFVRPNHIDSFGVAVAEALQLGTPAVASDVCNRAMGALVFPAGDYDAFRAMSLQALEQDRSHAMDASLRDILRQEIEVNRSRISRMIDQDKKFTRKHRAF